MAQAILDGRKTQTRRMILSEDGDKRSWVNRHSDLYSLYGSYDGLDSFPNESIAKRYKNKPGLYVVLSGPDGIITKCSYGKIGDVLWVRETWQKIIDNSGDQPVFAGFAYKTDNVTYPDIKWKPSIFMPKEACRIRLKITDISADKLQDISEEDAMAEGINKIDGKVIGYPFGVPFNYSNGLANYTTAIEAYQALWQSINGKGSWDKNPWIWKITFEKL